ncbi:hypothetical protein [Haloarchaeobius sp. DT45]|uniref:hypothetical protein n=1 Tax=Haloarchaeobius sp. DT45 TaxID=3446116 RepID=UPI003F6C780F
MVPGAAVFVIGLTVSRLSGPQVAEVSLYFVLLSGGVLAFGLLAEYLMKRLLATDQEREYYWLATVGDPAPACHCVARATFFSPPLEHRWIWNAHSPSSATIQTRPGPSSAKRGS